MANGTFLAGLAVFLVMLASVLGTVHRRERFGFAGGIVLFLAGQSLSLPGGVGMALAVVGLVAVVASAVPLLLE